MAMSTASDFPLPDEHGLTRVPNAVLAGLLAPGVDVELVAFCLRVLWWLDRSNGYPKSVRVDELRGDRTLVEVVRRPFDEVLGEALGRGYFVRRSTAGADYLLLNTASVARGEAVGVAENGESGSGGEVDDDGDAWGRASVRGRVPDAFRAYEENIGHLTPMIREAIKQSLQDFTDGQVEAAVRVAVESEARSWQFVAGVLRKWIRDGVPDERPESTGTGGTGLSETQLRRYLERQRKLQRRE